MVVIVDGCGDTNGDVGVRSSPQPTVWWFLAADMKRNGGGESNVGVGVRETHPNLRFKHKCIHKHKK